MPYIPPTIKPFLPHNQTSVLPAFIRESSSSSLAALGTSGELSHDESTSIRPLALKQAEDPADASTEQSALDAPTDLKQNHILAQSTVPSGTPSIAHRRQNSLKRKPVPAYIHVPIPEVKIIPDTSPASRAHPTLSNRGGPATDSAVTAESGSGASSPASIVTPNAESPVFPPPPPPRSLNRGLGLPPPPRRSSPSTKRSARSVPPSPLDLGGGSGRSSPAHSVPGSPLGRTTYGTVVPHALNVDLGEDVTGENDGPGKEEVIKDAERGQGRPSTFESLSGDVPAFGQRSGGARAGVGMMSAKSGNAGRISHHGYFPGDGDVNGSRQGGEPRHVSDPSTSGSLASISDNKLRSASPSASSRSTGSRSGSTVKAGPSSHATTTSHQARRSFLSRRLSDKSLPPLPAEAYPASSSSRSGHRQNDSVSTADTAMLATPTSLNEHNFSGESEHGRLPDHQDWSESSDHATSESASTIHGKRPSSVSGSVGNTSIDREKKSSSPFASASALAFGLGRKLRRDKDKDKDREMEKSATGQGRKVDGQRAPIPARQGSLAIANGIGRDTASASRSDGKLGTEDAESDINPRPTTVRSSSTTASTTTEERPSRPALTQQYQSEEKLDFSVDRIPSQRTLWEAGTHFLRDENGELVCFGDLFPSLGGGAESAGAVSDNVNGEASEKATTVDATAVATPHQRPRTILFFIRHFWCGQCQDFMQASVAHLDPEAMKASGIRVVVISNGSWKIIKRYKELFKCEFEVYVDAPRKLYQLMGMIKMTNDFGPWFSGRAAYHQRSVPGQLLRSGKYIVKMPIAKPGRFTQLGGEFILAPGYVCEFAHRMSTTSDHMEAHDVARKAGCLHPTRNEIKQVELAANEKEEVRKMQEEIERWRYQRAEELDRIQRRRAERRGEQYVPVHRGSVATMGPDDDLAMDLELEQAREELVRDESIADGSQSGYAHSTDEGEPATGGIAFVDSFGPVVPGDAGAAEITPKATSIELGRVVSNNRPTSTGRANGRDIEMTGSSIGPRGQDEEKNMTELFERASILEGVLRKSESEGSNGTGLAALAEGKERAGLTAEESKKERRRGVVSAKGAGNGMRVELV